jgi:Protein of unknown function (DUF2852)
MISFAARMNELPTPVVIALAIAAFVVWWPLGLAVLAYMLWSGRMMKCCANGFGQWLDATSRTTPDSWGQQKSSGNQAFDEYRSETLRHLEEEQRAFREFLSRLRMAKDKTEFDQFMTEERARPASPSSQPQA